MKPHGTIPASKRMILYTKTEIHLQIALHVTMKDFTNPLRFAAMETQRKTAAFAEIDVRS